MEKELETNARIDNLRESIGGAITSQVRRAFCY
jgi:hypothetical protein